MNYRPRIQAIIPNYLDSTSWYRAIAPLFALRKHNIDVHVKQDINWVDASFCDILFIQRPYGVSQLKIVEQAVNLNVPVWLDLDDDLTAIPDYNLHKKYFTDKNDQLAIDDMVKLASVITVSSKYLKDKYEHLNNNIAIIPNAHNDYLLPFNYNFSKKKIINWRGTNTHKDDLRSILEQLRTVQENEYTKDWLFNFIGSDSDILKGLIRCKTVKPMDLIEYFGYIKNLNPRIQLVPLVDNAFNRNKSNISWIEGTYSGAVCLAPDFPEWIRPGITTYSTDFVEKLCGLMQSELEALYQESYEYIKSNLLLSITNVKRKEIVFKLLK